MPHRSKNQVRDVRIRTDTYFILPNYKLSKEVFSSESGSAVRKRKLDALKNCGPVVEYYKRAELSWCRVLLHRGAHCSLVSSLEEGFWRTWTDAGMG